MSQQQTALESIREFLKSVTAYDVLPVSFKLVMLDTTLTLKGSLLTLLQNGVISAPLWNSAQSQFAGLMTASDYIDAIHYYATRGDRADQLNNITLHELSDIKSSMGAAPIARTSIDPLRTLDEASTAILNTKAHRIPLIDVDPDSGRDFVVSVLTQYRVLRFVALNCKQTQDLTVPIADLDLMTTQVETAGMSTSLAEVAATFSDLGVSCLPIVDSDGRLLNVYESYDMLTLAKGGSFASDLNLSVGEALMRRPQDYEGVLTCAESDTLAHIMEIIRRSRVLRLCVVDEDRRLKGLITLSDILHYLRYGDPHS